MPMAGVPVRVLVADNQHLIAAGTAAALDSLSEFELVGVAASVGYRLLGEAVEGSVERRAQVA